VIRVGGAMAMVPMLEELGVDPDRLLAEAGLSAGVFAHPDNVVPFNALCLALHLSADRTKRHDFGLRTGMRADLASLGVLGYLIANARSVGMGLQTLREFLQVHDEGATPYLIVEAGVAQLGYEVLEVGIVGADQMSFGAVAIGANILRAICGPGFEMRSVTFSFPRPAEVSTFRSFFKAPVSFNAERTAVAFDAVWLEQPVRGADPYLREILDAKVRDALAMRGDAFENRLRRVVRSLLAAGQCSQKEIARAFGMSRRSLRRRLEDSGFSFRSIVDEARHAAACNLLGSSKLSIVEVAAALGYADSSSFARAFRRWCGASPADWRRGERRALET
jgi:AraC-like DNA-binding protein